MDECVIPIELFREFAISLDFKSYLSLRLSCRSLNGYLASIINRYTGRITCNLLPNGNIHGDLCIRRNTNKKKIIKYADGKLHGRAVYYHRNGNVKKYCTYKSGKLEGLYLEYYPDKKVKTMCVYKNNLLHGECHVYDIDGNLSAKYFYKDSLLDGEIKVYWPSGNRKKTAVYELGKRNGLKVKFNDVPNSIRIKCEYKDDCKNGVYAEYRYGYLYKIYNYNNNILDGNYIKFCGDTVTVRKKYIDGAIAACVKYFTNGTIREQISYSLGIRNGICLEFYRNGRKKMSSVYKNDMLHGNLTLWDENSKLIYETNYYKNREHGANIEYNSLGEVTCITFYDFGKLISRDYY
jgi:uncharacterized protein